MFTFIHPYQKIRRLEQEIVELRTQLDASISSPSRRLLNLMRPVQSISLLQARNTDMLTSLNSGLQAFADQLAGERATLTGTAHLIAAAKQAVDTLEQRCLATKQGEVLTTLALAKTLHSLSQLQTTLARHAGDAQALAVSTALETAHSQGLMGSADAASQAPPGMAAIADDMHHLALTAHRLSHQLNLLMEQINSQVRRHSLAVAKQRLADDETARSSQTAKLAVHQLAEQSQHMHKVIHHSATAAFLHSAKLEHAEWKCRLYKQLLSADTDTSLEDCHQCRLGHWYHLGEGYQRYARTDAYRALAAPHRRMHDSGTEALTLARLGDQDGQQAALSVMEEASQQLALQIDNLIEHAIFEAPYATNHPSPLVGRLNNR